VGDYCLHDGSLYKCSTAISSPEAWTAGHWTQIKITGELATLNGKIGNKAYRTGTITFSVGAADWSDWGSIKILSKNLTGVSFNGAFTSAPNVVASAIEDGDSIACMIASIKRTASEIEQVTVVRATALAGSIKLQWIASGT
jgi:hypothetical protein